MSGELGYVGDPHGVLSACRDLIEAAESSVVLQMYLFAENGDQTLLLPRPGAFPYARTVAAWLVEKRRARPDVPVVVLLDANTPADRRLTRRKGELVRHVLRRAGVVVLDANLFVARFDPRRRLLPAMNLHLRPEDAPRERWVELANRWQFLHNVEDHRKSLVVDGGRAGAITSHNFFDPAFDWHENLFWLRGEPARGLFDVALRAVRDALRIPQTLSEADRAALGRLLDARPFDGAPDLAPTGAPVPGFPLAPPRPAVFGDGARLLENEGIRPRVEALIDGAGDRDELVVATSYFSDVPTLEALGRAAARGARVRVLVDSVDALPLPRAHGWLTRSLVNHDATRRAGALAARYPRFELRVHDSRGGAMMHLKTLARTGRAPALVGGHANLTPNSFSGAWLETDVETRAPAVVDAFRAHFDELWALEASRPAPPAGALQDGVRRALLGAFALVGLRP